MRSTFVVVGITLASASAFRPFDGELELQRQLRQILPTLNAHGNGGGNLLRQSLDDQPCNTDTDPFCDSNCTCATFCDNECAINATKPTNLTLYRMTMRDVLELSEKGMLPLLLCSPVL